MWADEGHTLDIFGRVCIILLSTTVKTSSFKALADILFPAQEHGDKAKPVPRNNTPLDRYATASWQLATIRVDADNSLTGHMVEPV